MRSFAIGAQFTALAIDTQGRFYISALHLGSSAIYRVDPNTGAASYVTVAVTAPNTGLSSHIVDFERQPNSERWFAVMEERYFSRRRFYFGEITGIGIGDYNVPEPDFWPLVALALCVGWIAHQRARDMPTSSDPN